jgi:hypothetical protein
MKLLIRFILGCVILPIIFALFWLAYAITVAVCPAKLNASLREANRAPHARP